MSTTTITILILCGLCLAGYAYAVPWIVFSIFITKMLQGANN